MKVTAKQGRRTYRDGILLHLSRNLLIGAHQRHKLRTRFRVTQRQCPAKNNLPRHRLCHAHHAIGLVLIGVKQHVIHPIHASFARLRQIRLTIVPVSVKRCAATKPWKTHQCVRQPCRDRKELTLELLHHGFHRVVEKIKICKSISVSFFMMMKKGRTSNDFANSR